MALLKLPARLIGQTLYLKLDESSMVTYADHFSRDQARSARCLTYSQESGLSTTIREIPLAQWNAADDAGTLNLSAADADLHATLDRALSNQKTRNAQDILERLDPQERELLRQHFQSDSP